MAANIVPQLNDYANEQQVFNLSMPASDNAKIMDSFRAVDSTMSTKVNKDDGLLSSWLALNNVTETSTHHVIIDEGSGLISLWVIDTNVSYQRENEKAIAQRATCAYDQTSKGQKGKSKERAYYNSGGWGSWRETATTESDTWSPVPMGSTVAGTWTPTATEALWTLTGKHMHLEFTVQGILSGATGYLIISGLPAAPKNYLAGGAVSRAIGLSATAVGNVVDKGMLAVTNAGVPISAQITNNIALFAQCDYEVF